jgi:hypothetical protein
MSSIEVIIPGQLAMSATTAKASDARAALFLDTLICTDLSSSHSKAHCPDGGRIAVLPDRSAQPATALTDVKARAPPMLTPINAANAKRS